ncbi:unnamed protein product [Cylindrotheca closterium]|uniref:ABM domain-containing protein n=1 Tax=Cylindrotheca closterium TaxID=2856 RepID=A0AAD2JPQ4_9STRA|nr:unnamed protein product [Cylindrotheca closterium]
MLKSRLSIFTTRSRRLVFPTTQSLTISSSSSSTSTTKRTINSDSLFALNLQCKVRPEIRNEWLKQIQEDQLCSRRDEPDCLQFVLGQGVDDENAFYLFELYRNKEAFQHHGQTPHFQIYNNFIESSQPYIGEPEVCFYHPLEETDSTTKRSIQKNSFGLNVNLYPKASVRNDFLKAISDNKKGTDTTEPLALQYFYGEATNAPGQPELDGDTTTSTSTSTTSTSTSTTSTSTTSTKPFYLHEQYSGDNHGKEGFDAHASSPHFAAWEDFVATDPFEKAPEVFFFRILEP